MPGKLRVEMLHLEHELFVTARLACLALAGTDLPFHFAHQVTDSWTRLSGLRPHVQLKITSAISPPRNALADFSPSTQRMASATLDLPQPFGPTMAVIPGWKFSEVLSANDLKPSIVRFFRYI